MVLTAMDFGRIWSNKVRLDGGPRTQPQVASPKGTPDSRWAATACSRSETTALIRSGEASLQVQLSSVQSQ